MFVTHHLTSIVIMTYQQNIMYTSTYILCKKIIISGNQPIFNNMHLPNPQDIDGFFTVQY